MPGIGEIRRGREIGPREYSNLLIWQACEVCGKERWVQLRKGRPVNRRCHPCALKDEGVRRKISEAGIRRNRLKGGSYNWKGGKTKTRAGYIKVRLYPGDFFYPMAGRGRYVFEHRLVVAKALGRCLHRWEIIHHKRGFAKDDNRYPETLELVQEMQHNQMGRFEAEIARLQKQVTLLESENILLREQIGGDDVVLNLIKGMEDER